MAKHDDENILNHVRILRAEGMAINFIEADEPALIKRRVEATAEAALNDLVTQAPAYGWTRLANRYVVHPSEPVWQMPISGKVITAERIEATRQFLALVRAQAKGLVDLMEPIVKGEPASPIYTEVVRLNLPQPLLTDLVELLGKDDRLVFTIERAASGSRILHFERLP